MPSKDYYESKPNSYMQDVYGFTSKSPYGPTPQPQMPVGASPRYQYDPKVGLYAREQMLRSMKNYRRQGFGMGPSAGAMYRQNQQNKYGAY